MKTRICLAALVLLAAGCSESEDTNTPEVQVNAKAIRIGQSVQGMTRAVVENGSAVTATVLRCDGETADWNGFVAESSNGIASGILNSRANTSTASFMAGTATTVSLNPTLYYSNADPGTTKSHLVAVAPAGTLAASGTTVTMKAVDGLQDVMYAKAVNAGSKEAPENAINLSFEHLTTQLIFQVKMTAAASNGDWTGKTVAVKDIKVQSAQLPQSVNAATGSVIWSNAALLSVPGINNIVLNATSTKAGNPIMIKGGESSVKLDVTLTVAGTDFQFLNVTIKDSGSDLATVTGRSHLITLNVIEPEGVSDGSVAIDVTATVAPWQVGTPGNADIK